MKISFLTLFPEYFETLQKHVLIQRALQKHLLDLQITDIRKYAKGSYRHLDDSVYGGGAGMVLKCEPVISALKAVRRENSHIVIVDPCGFPFTQSKARELSKKEDIIFLCGHYEGYDARIYAYADEVISIGDYILSSGEIASIVITDSIVRLLDGVLRKDSIAQESFETQRLEHYQYTRPAEFEGKKVPAVLTSGNHQAIQEYQMFSSLQRTMQYRPDLLERYPMTEDEKAVWSRYKK